MSDKKIESTNKKVNIISRFFNIIFNIFDAIKKHIISIKLAEKTIASIESTAKSIFKIALMFTLVTPLIPFALIGMGFMLTVMKILKSMASGTVRFLKLAMGLYALSPAILLFSMALMYSSIMLSSIAKPMTVLTVLGVLLVASLTFSLLGHLYKNTIKGALTVIAISAGLYIFGLGLSVFSKLISNINTEQMLIGIISLIAYGAVFTLLGMVWSQVLKGALVTLAIGLSLIVFGLGLATFTTSISSFGLGTLLMGALVLLAYGVVYTLLGIAITALAGAPLLGALGVLAIGLTLLIAAPGFLAFSAAMSASSVGDLLLGALVILAFGIAYTIVGLGMLLFGAPLLGAIAVIAMGISMPIFAVGLLAFSSLPALDIGNLLIGVLAMIGFGIAYTLLGIVSPLIILGAVAITAMSISLPLFIASLNSFFLLPELSLGQVLLFGVMLVGLTFAYALLGISSPLVMLGAVAITAMSVSLPLFILALSSLRAMPELSLDQVLLFGTLLAGLTVAYVGLGVASPLILLGAYSVKKMSESLMSLIGTLNEAMKFDWNKVPIDQIRNVLVGLASAFATVGGDGGTGVGGFITGMLNTIGIGPNNVQRGIESTLQAGRALIELSKGLVGYNDMMKTLDLSLDDSGRIKQASFLEKLKLSITAISETFAAVGKSGNYDRGMFAWMYSKNDIEEGIRSVMKSGDALRNVATGLFDFQSYTASLNFDKNNPNSITNNIKNVLTVILEQFSNLGKADASGWFNEGEVTNGIDSVKNVGNVFKTIAEGLSVWGDLEKNGIVIDTIKTNIQNVLTMIHTQFANLGKADASGLFNEGEVTNGIDSVKNVGKVFKDIADALKIWSDLEQAGMKTEAINTNIEKVLTMISTQFSEIGKSADGSMWGSSDVENGIKSVKGVGNVFKEIAEALKVWSDLEQMGFKAGSFDPSQKNSIAWNMLEVLNATSKIFAEIGSKSVVLENEDKDGNKTRVVDSAVKRGIESVQGVGSILKDVGDSLKSFAAVDSLQLPNIKKNITEILSLVSTVFAEIGKGKTGDLDLSSDNVKKGVESIKGVGKELELISKSIAPFADLQKGDNKIDIDKLKQNIKDILTTSLVLMGAVGVAQDPKSAKFAETYFGKDAWLMNAYHIENGVKALEAGTDGLEFISKASDMVKKVSDSSKDLNFYSVQEQVKSIIITSMSFISALGAGQSNKDVIKKYLGEDAVLFTIDNIKKGEEILNQSKTSMESLINLSDIVNSDKLNIANWEQKKNVIKELIYSPIDTMGKLLQSYKYDDVVKWFNYLLPMISGKIEDMFKMLDNGYDGTLGKLNLDLKFFYKEILNQNIEAKKMDNLDKIVKFFERWAKIEDPFAKFAKTFNKYLGDFKEYVKAINDVNTDKLIKMTEYDNQLYELVKVDPSQLLSNSESIKSLIISLQTATQPMAQPTQQDSGGFLSGLFGGSTAPQPVAQAPQPVVNQFDDTNLTSKMDEIIRHLNDIKSGSTKLSIKK